MYIVVLVTRYLASAPVGALAGREPKLPPLEQEPTPLADAFASYNLPPPPRITTTCPPVFLSPASLPFLEQVVPRVFRGLERHGSIISSLSLTHTHTHSHSLTLTHASQVREQVVPPVFRGA